MYRDFAFIPAGTVRLTKTQYIDISYPYRKTPVQTKK
jgi:hypothetical protein